MIIDLFYTQVSLQGGYNERGSLSGEHWSAWRQKPPIFSGDRLQLRYHIDVFYHRELQIGCNERASFSGGRAKKRQ